MFNKYTYEFVVVMRWPICCGSYKKLVLAYLIQPHRLRDGFNREQFISFSLLNLYFLCCKCINHLSLILTYKP